MRANGFPERLWPSLNTIPPPAKRFFVLRTAQTRLWRRCLLQSLTSIPSTDTTWTLRAAPIALVANYADLSCSREMQQVDRCRVTSFIKSNSCQIAHDRPSRKTLKPKVRLL